MTPGDRLKEWRKWRKEIITQEDRQLLESVVYWWKFTPLMNKVLDIYDSEDWPDPWMLLWDAKFDEHATALGMAYTLHLMDWPCDLVLIQTKTGMPMLVVAIDDEHVLNFTYGEIDTFAVLGDCTVVKRWSTDDLV